MQTKITTPHKILQNIYGYQTFRGEQESIINDLVAGHDALVLMPTGAGKSLCYQIPALSMPGMGIVISPLIAPPKTVITGQFFKDESCKSWSNFFWIRHKTAKMPAANNY